MVHPVVLVGAGPGDPGLITVRGFQALQRAEVVIADRLVSGELLARLHDSVELHVRGERRSALGQEEINRLLVERARAGLRVVRLKGGDPFVFGRGGEEAEALAAAGIPFEVVPGVTAAIAAPAYAGIPVTHRHVAGAVAFITGHEAESKDSGLVDWEALARGATTLVLYMSVTHLPAVTRRLIAAGRAPSTPAAVIERGTTRAQRTVVGTLADIAARAAGENVQPPALTIVGEVVALRGSLGWFETRPLHRKRLLAVSVLDDNEDDGHAPSAPPRDITAELDALGLEVSWRHPLRVTEHPENLRDLMSRLGRVPWIAFTSVRGVTTFSTALREARLDGRALVGTRVACLAGKTAIGVTDVLRLVPDLLVEGGGQALADALLARGPVAGPVVLVRAAEGRPEFAETLRAAGVEVEVIDGYETIVDNATVQAIVEEAQQDPFDAVVFGSPRCAAALLDAGLDPGGALVGAIGRTTARFLEERGLNVGVVASRPSFATLLSETAAALAQGSRKE